jgi:hypothetical protein
MRGKEHYIGITGTCSSNESRTAGLLQVEER